MQKLFITIFIIIVSLILLINNNRSTNTQSSSDKLQVVVSFYPIFFFSNQIGGEKAEVITITPSGVQPHDYELTTQDLIKVNRSDLLVLNGGGLAGWEKKLKDELSKKTIVVVADDKSDPHVWLDPILAKDAVSKIVRGFEKADPQNKIYYQSNAKSLEKKLDSLDSEFKRNLSVCQKKDFVTSHDAFGYLAKRYGIYQVAISGLSPEEEPSSQKLAEITDKIKKEKIAVIFFERLVSPKLSETIANETGATTLVLDPIEGSAGPDYFSLMRNNLNNLKKALQCK